MLSWVLKTQRNFARSSTLQQPSFIFILIPDKVYMGATFNEERVLVCVWITSWMKQVLCKDHLALEYVITKWSLNHETKTKWIIDNRFLFVPHDLITLLELKCRMNYLGCSVQSEQGAAMSKSFPWILACLWHPSTCRGHLCSGQMFQETYVQNFLHKNLKLLSFIER
jgi:hypothetical protein